MNFDLMVHGRTSACHHIKSLQLLLEQGTAQLNTSEMLQRANSDAIEYVKR